MTNPPPNQPITYYKQTGQGPDIILIPDGLGESDLFSRAIPYLASQNFRITTFDTPGMSRSSSAPVETYTRVTGAKLAAQIVSLLDSLDIQTATFFGSSSGGSAVLSLLINHPSRVRNAFAHEVPTYPMPGLSALADLETDDAISTQLASTLPTDSCGDVKAWTALGGDVHARLWKNYPRWACGYPRSIPEPVYADRLKGRPLFWTVGADTPTARFFDNIVTAVEAGVDVGCLPGMHFPYVSHPEAFAKHIVDNTRKYL